MFLSGTGFAGLSDSSHRDKSKQMQPAVMSHGSCPWCRIYFASSVSLFLPLRSASLIQSCLGPSALGLCVSTHCHCQSALSKRGCCNHRQHTAAILSQTGETQAIPARIVAVAAVNMSFLLFQYQL